MIRTLCALLVVAQAGCSSAGENISYAVWNSSSEHEIEDTKLVAADGSGKILYANAVHRMRPKGSPGWRYGRMSYLPDNQHHMPDRVAVSWRLPPRAGQQPEPGELVGPFEINLKSVVPADVLKKATGNTRFKLEIGVAAGVEPVSVRWRLSEMVPGKPGLQEIQRGGDWSLEPAALPRP